jgi:hypothetical protein
MKISRILALVAAASTIGIAAQAAAPTSAASAPAKSPKHPVVYCKKGHPKAIVQERTEDGDNVHFVLVAAKGGQPVADFTAPKADAVKSYATYNQGATVCYHPAGQK